MPSAGFEPAITAVKRLQAYALDRTPTEIGSTLFRALILLLPLYAITVTLLYLSSCLVKCSYFLILSPV
jgi:hypothetical protein